MLSGYVVAADIDAITAHKRIEKEKEPLRLFDLSSSFNEGPQIC